jgi:hypothetical protein
VSVPITTLYAQEEMLEAPAVSPGFLNGAKVHLFSSPYVPSRSTPLADLTAIEANYAGYAAVAAGTWGDAIVLVDGSMQILAPSIQFTPSGSTSPNTIYGAYLTDAGGTNLIYVEPFDVPVPLPDENSGLVYTPHLVYGS